MVFQHFMLADNLTVLENVVLGAEKLHGIGDGARREIKRISDAYKLDVDPDALVADLGVGARQRIEILKVLFRGAKTLILDEPTAVLVPQEVDELFDQLGRAQGRGPHRPVHLPQARRGAQGRRLDHRDPARHHHRHRRPQVGQRPAARRAHGRLRAALAHDRGVHGHRPRPAHGRRPRPRAAAPAAPVLDGISLTIHAGEVLGIAGVEGNGQAELVEVIMGMREPTLGRRSSSATPTSPTGHVREIREAGVGYIPEDRHRHALLLEAPLWENRILGHQTEAPNVKGQLIDAAAAKADTERIVKEYDVRTPSIFVTAGSLSGGNQQKLIIGREMSHKPKVLIAAHPTRGVDVGAQSSIWDHIRDGAARGPRRAAHLGRPRGADRPVRHHPRDPARQALRRLRPRHT